MCTPLTLCTFKHPNSCQLLRPHEQPACVCHCISCHHPFLEPSSWLAFLHLQLSPDLPGYLAPLQVSSCAAV